MMKIFAFLILFLFTSTAEATWLKVPVIGRGVTESEKDEQTGPWRPKLPTGVKGFSGHPVTDGNGVIQYFVVWVNEIPARLTLQPGQSIVSRATAIAEIGSKGNVNQSERLPDPSPIRESLLRLWNLAYSYIGPAIAWAVTDTEDCTGTGALSGDWTNAPDSSAAPVRSGDECRSGAAMDLASSARNTLISPGADQYSQFKIATWAHATGGGSGDWIFLLLRSNATDTYYSCVIRDGNTANIYEQVGGAGLTNIAAQSSTFVATDIARCEVSGTNIALKKNGVDQVTVSDNSIASGSVGFGMVFCNCNTPNAADVEIDDWEGGDLPAATPPRRGITIIQ